MAGYSLIFGGLLVFTIIMLLIVIGMYIWSAIEYQKIFKLLGYDKPWLAWIPIGCYYGLAEVTRDSEGNSTVLGQKVPNNILKFWWVLGIILYLIPRAGGLLFLLLQTICFGANLVYIYAKLENKSEDEVKGLGYVSGFIPLIALIKFSTYKSNY